MMNSRFCPLLTCRRKLINLLSIDVKILMISFPRLSCLVLSWRHVTIRVKKYRTNGRHIFVVYSGDCSLHDFKHEGLAKITAVQWNLLAYWVSFTITTNQIAHYINGPIESAVAYLGLRFPCWQRSLMTRQNETFLSFQIASPWETSSC